MKKFSSMKYKLSLLTGYQWLWIAMLFTGIGEVQSKTIAFTLHVFHDADLLATDAQCSLVCNSPFPSSPLDAAVNQNCEAEITADMILEDPSACPGPKFLEVRSLSGGLIVSGSEPVTVPQFFLGNTLGVTVIDVNSGNQCTGYIRLIDGLQPIFYQGCPDVTISCTDNPSPSYSGYPHVTDNCDQDLTLTYIQSQTTPDCSTLSPYFSVITRTWTVTDDFNNQNACTQKIYLLKETMQDLLFPGTHAQSCSNTSTHPNITGWPTINGNPITGDNCCFFVSWSDQVIPSCGNSYTIYRTWIVFLSSTFELQTGLQLIYVLDTVPPDINCQPLITIVSENNQCTASFSLQEATAVDNCSAPDDLVLSVNTSFGGNGTGPFFDIPGGSFTVTYTAQDECGNIGTCQTTLHIECQPLVDICAIIDQLIAEINAAAGINNGIKNALSTQLDNVAASFENGNENAAVNRLTATLNFLNAQSGNQIPAHLASAWAGVITDVLVAIADGRADCDSPGSASAGYALGAGTTEAEPHSMALFPNPTTGELHIPLPHSNAYIQVFNSLGQLMLELQAAVGTERLDLSGWAHGMYWVRVRVEGLEEEMLGRVILKK